MDTKNLDLSPSPALGSLCVLRIQGKPDPSRGLYFLTTKMMSGFCWSLTCLLLRNPSLEIQDKLGRSRTLSNLAVGYSMCLISCGAPCGKLSWKDYTIILFSASVCRPLFIYGQLCVREMGRQPPLGSIILAPCSFCQFRARSSNLTIRVLSPPSTPPKQSSCRGPIKHTGPH